LFQILVVLLKFIW